MIANLIFIYLAGGFLCLLLSSGRPLMIKARIVAFLIWPWMFWAEGTPRMERFLDWAERRRT